MQTFRVSASGIIFDQDKVLLVRYRNEKSNFLVGPGGGVLPEEDLYTGLKREVFEETRLHVNPGKVLLIEDLLASKYRVIKIWFLCTIVGSTTQQNTEEAKIEEITEVGWFNKDQLKNEIVYPEILKSMNWQDIVSRHFEATYFPLKKANF
jgi:8-oxo-dGTP pyrophosphatase MutT (NUDIX family)